ncbi:MAG: oligosaccharide flippase family protein, partial [Aliifodinibius sp.]|nr:oligosaccharide flippase family protein [Fodinibius sp.]NIV12423.1 oligosaccharide flippase family protein [Fodinibius sp.]NIY26087.1 oligosaccharide flippase family protein [Fodinibius sp.]
TRRHLNSSFSLLFTCSIILAAFLYMEPELIAGWLGNADISSLIKYLSPVIPLSAFNVIPRVILNRHLSFRRIAAAEFVSTAVYGIVTGAMALVLRNVWCFVFGVIAEQIMLAATLW